MDKRLVIACDKFINKLLESNVSLIQTKSQLIEQALLKYFNDLQETQEITKGVESNEN